MSNSWKNLGLIHILVVSGGHLSILAALLVHILRNRFTRRIVRHQVATLIVGFVLIFFGLANRLQPPVLRSLIEWLIRKPMTKRGWRSPEIALITTWLALPFCATIYDLLSLALSFFASVTVESTVRKLHRHPFLSLVALQISVWWILVPLLFTMGLPHPLTTMTNIILAPLLGATLIPLAMLTLASGAAPELSGYRDDPLYFGSLFDFVWQKLSIAIRCLAEVLPEATPKLSGVRPLLPGHDESMVLVLTVLCATCALLVRSQRERRRRELRRSTWRPAIWVAAGLAGAVILHHALAVSP